MSKVQRMLVGAAAAVAMALAAGCGVAGGANGDDVGDPFNHADSTAKETTKAADDGKTDKNNGAKSSGGASAKDSAKAKGDKGANKDESKKPEEAVTADGTWIINHLGIGKYVIGAKLSPQSSTCTRQVFNDAKHGTIWQLGHLETPDKAAEVFLWRSESIPANSPKTEKGIGLGSTREQFDQAYPDSTGTYFPGTPPNTELFGPRVILDDDVPITFQFDADDVIEAVVVGTSIFQARYCED